MDASFRIRIPARPIFIFVIHCLAVVGRDCMARMVLCSFKGLLARFCNLFGCSSSEQPYLWNHSLSRLSACLDGPSASGQSNIPSPPFTTQETAPPVPLMPTQHLFTVEILQPPVEEGYLQPWTRLSYQVRRDGGSRRCLWGTLFSLRLSSTVPRGATLPPILDKSASIAMISPPRRAWA